MKTQTLNKIKAVLFLLLLVVISVIIIYNSVSLVMQTVYPRGYSDIVEAKAEEYNVDKALLYALIETESGFDENAVSSVGARGLMQIMPETFLWLCEKEGEAYTEEDLFTPEVNIKYGTMYYGMMLKKFGDIETAVAAYHAGTTNVKKWLSDENYSLDGKTLYDIPFPQTKAYVERVMKTKNIYEKNYDLTEE